MARTEFKRRLPGYIATGLVILTTSGWTFWGLGEMSYEGWGSRFPAPMRYLIPGAACLALTLVALTWPLLGGWLPILISGAFTAWWWRLAASRGWLNLRWILSTWPLQMSSLAILTLSYYRPEVASCLPHKRVKGLCVKRGDNLPGRGCSSIILTLSSHLR